MTGPIELTNARQVTVHRVLLGNCPVIQAKVPLERSLCDGGPYESAVVAVRHNAHRYDKCRDIDLPVVYLLRRRPVFWRACEARHVGSWTDVMLSVPGQSQCAVGCSLS